MSSSDSDDPNFLFRVLAGEENQNQPPASSEPEPESEPTISSHPIHSLSATLLTRELPKFGLSFRLWPSALALLRLLDLRPSLLPIPPRRPLRILELGSGTGLPAIAAAAILPASSTLTDLPHALPNLRLNASLNLPLVLSRGGDLSVTPLRWGHHADLQPLVSSPPFDLVLASDVVYYEELVDPLLDTARELVRGQTVWLMAHLRRWRRTDAAFFRKAQKSFHIEVIHREDPPAGARIGVVIYKFMEKKKLQSKQVVDGNTG